MRTVLLSLALGCSGGETATPPGTVGLCFDGPEVGMSEARGLWRASGVVSSLEAVAEPAYDGCEIAGATPRWAQLVDDDGGAWAIGWSATEGSGEDVLDRSPQLSLQPGDRIDVAFNLWVDWEIDAAAEVRDASGPRLAAAEGAYTEVWPELDAGMEVTDAGAVRSLGDDGCGKRSTRALRFEADDAVEVAIGVQGTLTWDGVEVEVRNVGAWEFDGVIDCTDTWGRAPWMTFR